MPFIPTAKATEAQRTRVLLVDDDASLCELFRKVLGQRYDVELASSGEEGLRLIEKSEPFAVVITDQVMPSMGGIEFLMHVKEHSPRTVRLMLTGHNPAEIPGTVVERGNVFRVLTKPIRNEELLESVAAAVQQYVTS